MNSANSTVSVLRNLNRVLNNPAQLRAPERLMLYALVVAWKPRYALEIGSAEGGSALLTCAAMDDMRWGSGWDAPPPDEPVNQRLERNKSSNSYRLVPTVKCTPVYRWYARRANGDGTWNAVRSSTWGGPNSEEGVAARRRSSRGHELE